MRDALQVEPDIDWLLARDREPLITPEWPQDPLKVLVVVEELPERAGLRAAVVFTAAEAKSFATSSEEAKKRQLWFSVLKSSVVQRFRIEL